MRQKKMAIVGVSAAMLVGAGTGLFLSLPGGAGASLQAATATDPGGSTADTTAPVDTTAPADTTATDNTTATVDTTPANPTTDDSGTDGAPHRGFGLKSSLDELVSAGTITQAQADAIIAAFQANFPAPGQGGPGFGGGNGHDHGPFGGHGGPGRGKSLETVATALGITADELKTELQAGKTIADVAAEKGVDVQTVIDAIVAEQTANITERVTNMVNGVRPERPADDDTATSTTTADSGTGS